MTSNPMQQLDIELVRLLQAANQSDPKAVMRISKGITAGDPHQAVVQLAALAVTLLEAQLETFLEVLPPTGETRPWQRCSP